MKQKRGNIEVIGMPFLDMVSCAFGGVIVLYLLSQEADGTAEPFIPAFEVINVADSGSSGGFTGTDFTYGMRLHFASAKPECLGGSCSGSGKVLTWTVNPGATDATVPLGSPAPDKIEVFATGGTGLLSQNCIHVDIESGNKSWKNVELPRVRGFSNLINTATGNTDYTC